jgi:hypothetical protein
MVSNIDKSIFNNAYRRHGKRKTISARRRYWLSFSRKKIGAFGEGLTLLWGRPGADQYAGCWLNLESRKEC